MQNSDGKVFNLNGREKKKNYYKNFTNRKLFLQFYHFSQNVCIRWSGSTGVKSPLHIRLGSNLTHLSLANEITFNYTHTHKMFKHGIVKNLIISEFIGKISLNFSCNFQLFDSTICINTNCTIYNINLFKNNQKQFSQKLVFLIISF